MVRQLIYLGLLLHRSALRQAQRSECQGGGWEQPQSVVASIAESRPESHSEIRWLCWWLWQQLYYQDLLLLGMVEAWLKQLVTMLCLLMNIVECVLWKLNKAAVIASNQRLVLCVCSCMAVPQLANFCRVWHDCLPVFCSCVASQWVSRTF